MGLLCEYRVISRFQHVSKATLFSQFKSYGICRFFSFSTKIRKEMVMKFAFKTVIPSLCIDPSFTFVKFKGTPSKIAVRSSIKKHYACFSLFYQKILHPASYILSEVRKVSLKIHL